MKTAPVKTALAFVLGSVFSIAFLVKCGSGTNKASASGGSNWEYAAVDAYNGDTVDMPTGETAPDISKCKTEASPATINVCILNILGGSGWQLMFMLNDLNGDDLYLGRQTQ